MLARLVVGAVAAGAMIGPAVAGQMNANEALKFVAGKVFAFTCFDGTRGAGRVLDDGGAAGAVQFGGSGPVRQMRLPGNTLHVRGHAVCATIKGIPFEPCFSLYKKDERNFRGSVSGMDFAYCDFRHQEGAQMLLARSVARPRSLHPAERTGSVEVSEPVELESPRKESVGPGRTRSTSAPELRRVSNRWGATLGGAAQSRPDPEGGRGALDVRRGPTNPEGGTPNAD
jgi:hypothetical protein